MKNVSKLVLPVLALVMMLFTTTVVTAQSKSNTKDFLIRVNKDGQNIKLKCIEGCAWTDLEFSITNKSAQDVDQYGKVTANTATQKKDKNLSDFQFSAAIVNNGFTLNGVKGTSWEKLNFADDVVELINREGILTKQ